MFVKKLKNLPEDLKKILEVCSRVADRHKFSVFLIGGIVRDILLKRENYDLDLVIEGDGIAYARILAEKFNAEMRKHHAFGTAAVYCREFKIDIATARKESYAHWGALPGVQPALLKHDLFRRDFTVNAMAVSLNKDDYGALLDFYNGFQDLKGKKIRVLHDNSFLDDPTRIFRAIRFEQRFSFHIERHTLRLLKESVKSSALDLVHEHRIREELVSILSEQKAYSCLRRINGLLGFSFLHHSLRPGKNDFSLLRRISHALKTQPEKFPLQNRPQSWVVFMMGLTAKLPARARKELVLRYGFRKRERELFLSFLNHKEHVRRLGRIRLSRVKVYEILKDLSPEELLFYYAFFPDPRVRRRISFFLSHLYRLRLKLRGRDLKDLGIKPAHLYGRMLRELFYLKIEKGLSTREEELEELKSLWEKISCGHSRFKV